MIVATIAREESSVTRPRIMSAVVSWASSVRAPRDKSKAPNAITPPVMDRYARDRLSMEAIPKTIVWR